MMTPAQRLDLDLVFNVSCPLWVISGHRDKSVECRFTPESGHSLCKNKCLLCAKSGPHWPSRVSASFDRRAGVRSKLDVGDDQKAPGHSEKSAGASNLPVCRSYLQRQPCTTLVCMGFPATSPLRDTWEHIETDPPSTNGGGGAGVNVSLITVTPTSAFPGDQVVANISLTSPAPPGTKVELSWATQNNPTQTIISTVASVPSGATAAEHKLFRALGVRRRWRWRRWWRRRRRRWTWRGYDPDFRTHSK